MDAALLRAYVARRWDLVAREKDRFRAERFRRDGPAATLVASLALRTRWHQIHGEPSAASRQADLDAHVALANMLERARLAVAAR